VNQANYIGMDVHQAARDKRISQQLRAPVESVSGDFVDLPTSAA
jgi:hypothetical protein